MLISLHHFFLFIFSASVSTFLLAKKLTEQYTEEQQDTQAIGGETSGLDTKLPKYSEESTQYRDSIPLSLIDHVTGMVVRDSLPEEAAPNFAFEAVSVVEGKDDSKKSTTIAKVPG